MREPTAGCLVAALALLAGGCGSFNGDRYVINPDTDPNYTPNSYNRAVSDPRLTAGDGKPLDPNAVTTAGLAADLNRTARDSKGSLPLGAPVGGASRNLAAADPYTRPHAARSAPPSSFEQAQAQLSARGVTDMKLEAVPATDEWRFTCSVPDADRKRNHRYEAIDRSPMAAVTTALERIDAER